MTQHLNDVLDELCLGLLPPSEAEAAERHLLACTTCAEAFAQTMDTYGALALAVTPIAPASALSERLLASLDGRFERFAREVARMLDVGLDRARKILDGIDVATSWVTGPGERVELYHLEGGVTRSNAVIGIVRIAPGGSFPVHRHLGEEVTLILQGGYEDDHGVVMHTGDLRTSEAGSSHGFTALPGEELIYLATIEAGLEVGDLVFLPGDPRV